MPNQVTPTRHIAPAPARLSAQAEQIPVAGSSIFWQLQGVINSSQTAKSQSPLPKSVTQRAHVASKIHIHEIPRKKKETRTDYAKRLQDADPKLSRQELSELAGITRLSITGAVAFRGKTAGSEVLKKIPREPGEKNIAYGRRLKKIFDKFPGRDYAKVSGAPLSSLMDFAEFQKVTPKVLWVRRHEEAWLKVNKRETFCEWGVRLFRQYGLTFGECSAVTGMKAGYFRNAIRRLNAVCGDQITINDPLINPRNYSNLANPAGTVNAWANPVQAQDNAIAPLGVCQQPSMQEVNNIADWMLRAPGSFNHQLGDQAITLLLNSGKLPENTVIVVTTPGQATLYLRGDNNLITRQEVMMHESEMTLLRTGGQENAVDGSAPQAHYNLLHNRLLIPNTPDGDCLYRAVAQHIFLRAEALDTTQNQEVKKNLLDLDREIQALRHDVADTFIASPQRYLERLDRQALARECAQIAKQRTPMDTPKAMSQGSSIGEVESLASTVSQLSLSESESSASAVKLDIKEKIKRGMTALLPGMLAELREVRPDQPEMLLEQVRASQIVSRAAIGIMSGEAETAGTLVLQEVAEILLVVLDKYPDKAPHVFAALVSDDAEERLEFINTLPLIMGHKAVLKVTQLFNKLSQDSSRKQQLLDAMLQKHIADRPFPMAYIGRMNFFERMNVASKRIGLLFFKPSETEPQNQIINMLMEKTDHIAQLANQQLDAAKLVTKPSFINRLGSSLIKHKKKQRHLTQPQALAPLHVVTDKPIITETILRQALEVDNRSVERMENLRDSRLNVNLQLRQQSEKKSSESLRASVVAGGLIAGGLYRQNERERQRSLAEREGRDSANDRQKAFSRAHRDHNSDVLRYQSLDPMRLGVSLAMHKIAEDMRQDLQPARALLPQTVSQPPVLLPEPIEIIDIAEDETRAEPALLDLDIDYVIEDSVSQTAIDLEMAILDYSPTASLYGSQLTINAPSPPLHDPFMDEPLAEAYFYLQDMMGPMAAPAEPAVDNFEQLLALMNQINVPHDRIGEAPRQGERAARDDRKGAEKLTG